jgi:ATP-binding cassette subfamily B protein
VNKATFRSRIATVAWAIKTAWRINRTLLLIMFILVAALAVLPAVSLGFNREVIEQLSNFITTGTGSFEEVLPALLKFGLILAVIGLSQRVNIDFIRTMMDSVYRYGTQELLMDSIHRFPIAELFRRNVNEDFNYIVRRAEALNNLIGSICAIGGKAFSIVSLCIVAWSLSRPVLVITVLYVAAAVALNASFSKSTRLNWPKFRKAQVKAQYLQKMPEDMNVAKEIRIYDCAEEIISSWKTAYSQEMDMEIERFKATEKRNFLTGLGFYLFLAVVVVYTLVALANGQLAPDVFLVTYTLCISLFNVISNLARDLLDFDTSIFSLEQQRNLLRPTSGGDETQVSCVPPPVDEQTVFRARDLSFTYENGNQALKGVNFEVKRGEVIALIGENGSGKSTLVKLLTGLYQPATGELLFHGQPYAAYPSSHLHTKIGVFFQDYYLFHHLLSENVAYGGIDHIDDREKIERAIQRGGASKVLAKLPKGIDTLLGKRIDKSGVELSGGEKQLVAIARAYMSDKDVLIFDEPASMLDPLAEVNQFQSIQDTIHHKTGILISHRIGFARLASRIIMMKDGGVAETGTHNELMMKDGVYAAFFREQAQWYESEAAPLVQEPQKPSCHESGALS